MSVVSPLPKMAPLCFPPSSPSPSSPATASASASGPAVMVLSKCTIYPDQKSTMSNLKLSVSDLPMLSCHYIQKGLFFPPPPMPITPLLSLLKASLSRALSFFPPLAGRLSTDSDGAIYIGCNDAGAEFIHSIAPSLTLPLLLPGFSDVHPAIKSLFALDNAVSYHGHHRPLAAFQVTELGDRAIFIGCTVSHAVVDGTSFWNFFNAWAELCRVGPGTTRPSRSPDFRRDFFGESEAVLRFPNGQGPDVTFDASAPLRERKFSFSRDAVLQLRSMANDQRPENEISSFQSLCALLWVSVTRARKQLGPDASTTFRMAVNCRHRIVPPVGPLYFGNAIQSIPVTAKVGELTANGVSWAANLLHDGVVSRGDERVREEVARWEAAPRCFPLGNPDGAAVTMGSSPRFPMYEGNDFGWGRPVAVGSGRGNKFDGKMSAFPGRNGDGSLELEVCLAPETMAGLLEDEGFMYFVSK